MSFTIEISIQGDGRRKAEETVGAAIAVHARDPRVLEFFREHPTLRMLDPIALLEGVSRKRASRLIESGLLDSEDGSLDPERVIPRGRSVEVVLPFPILLAGLDYLPPTATRETPAIDVLYEDDDYLAVNKPPELPSAPIRSDQTDSAVHRALALYPDLPVLRGNLLEPGLVHRLDNGTSGVLLFVKTTEAFARLEKTWNTGAVAKVYRALVGNAPTSGGGNAPDAQFFAKLPRRADLLIGHDLKSKKRMRVQAIPADAKKLRGEPMAGRTEIVRSRDVLLPSDLRGRDLEIRIETGIHHQIRATLAHFGYPILGDSTYQGAPSERLWLQAWKLALPDAGGRKLEITAPLPEGWPD